VETDDDWFLGFVEVTGDCVVEVVPGLVEVEVAVPRSTPALR
jgi:hypothetical protein